MPNLLKDAPHFGPSFIGLSEQVALHGVFRANDIAFIQGGRRVNWRGFNEQANKIAQELIHLGVQSGDRVAMLFSCEIEAMEVIFGIWRAGAAYVPMSYLLTADLIAGMIEDSGAKLLVSSQAHAELAQNASSLSKADLIVTDQSWASNLKMRGPEEPGIAINPNALANIIYSSGTTGIPKGIPHTHGARSAFVTSMAGAMRYSAQSTGILAIPPHSNGSMLTWGPTAFFGAPTILMPKFEVDDFFALIDVWRPTHGFVVPTMCSAILSHPNVEGAGLDCFECAVTAGAPMPPTMKQEMMRLTDGGLAELWGLTESVATLISPSEMIDRPNSVGRPCPGMDIKLIDHEGHDVTFKGEGEIVGRSTNLMNGYWNRPDTNTEILWESKEGIRYIRTGDVGEFDDDGYLYIRGRIKDMLISGGLNVFPADIEAILIENSDVHDACVIGVPHEKWGETPVAFVTPNERCSVDPINLADWLNTRVANHQRVSKIVVWESDFPRNTLGKVLKHELKKKWSEIQSRDES
nr:class I adenylate-forming enzyme family protein [Hyphomonas sp. Mor2]